jgi:CRISPR-associated endonuclease/helicase Cas3
MTFPDFFKTATGNLPYDYQDRLAMAPSASRLICIPTGLGKTAAVILAWLWNRVAQPDTVVRNTWPRRLIYCLPMRTLVEQTRDEAEKWIKELSSKNLLPGKPPKVIILMGGEETTPEDKDWDLYPGDNTIIIGTQDMLLSRALNRGYGMSRYRWPMHFGLLNNDALWVLDETQLMGPGVGTAAQLEAFRQKGDLGSFPSGRSVTWYSSATPNTDHLITREWRAQQRHGGFHFRLSDDEKKATDGTLAQRRLAKKTIESHQEWHFGDKQVADRADEIIRRHQAMLTSLQKKDETLPRRTLIICNTVSRAVAVHMALKKKLGEQSATDLKLMHSRFRQMEREFQRTALGSPLPAGGEIIVATQVIEAGVDLSSAILWSEIAPLASLVQRLGRLNRGGEFGFGSDEPTGFVPQAILIGLDLPVIPATPKEEREMKEKEARLKHLPYDMHTCIAAWPILKKMARNASPAAFEDEVIAEAIAASIPSVPYSLQRHELLDFFDTDSNLSLGFTDVSPFVRGTDPETDFQVLWRDWDGSKPDCPPDFQRQEFCSVSFGKVKDARAILNQGWIWRGKEAGWMSARESDVYPGMTILLPCKAGGYSEKTGWTGIFDKDNPVRDIYQPRSITSDEEMLSSLENGWRSISTHTQEVRDTFDAILSDLPDDLLSPEERQANELGIRWHDSGKNHLAWKTAARKALADAGIEIAAKHNQLAKFSLSESPSLIGLQGDELKREITKLRRSFKPGMAHEVASALAFRQSEQDKYGIGAERPIFSLLAEYLIMAHHGHVRKVLRDELPKNPIETQHAETVRGISHGETLEAVQIGAETLGPITLSTDCRKMGRDADGNESYTRGVLRLLEHYGPFRLAYFEAIFRSADIRASIFAKDNSPA